MQLKNKKALITGGTSGIGLATAKLFLEEGAQVIITGRTAKEAQHLVEEYGPDRVSIFLYNAALLTDIVHLADHVANRFKNLDIAFINAGIARFAPMEDITEAIFDEVINVNFKGAFFTLQQLSPLFSREASVILTASSGIHKAHAGAGVYSASKAALRNLAITLSAEWTRRGIRVNVISPGATDTAVFDTLGFDPAQLPAIKESFAQSNPHGRLVSPVEIAHAALYLASPGSASQIGTEMIVDGGAFVKA